MWFELHKHTAFSLFDGFGRVEDVVKYAKKLGWPAVAISDHGNVCGALELQTYCKKHDLKPIVGCEVYFQQEFNTEKRYYHLNLFAMNNKGYENLMKIVTIANKKFFHRKPIVPLKALEKYNEGLICTTACIGSIWGQLLLNDKVETAYKVAKKFKKIFGKNFYIEIMLLPIDNKGSQEKVNELLFEMSDDLNIKCIPTNDSHFTSKDDWDAYCLMHKISGSGYDYETTYQGRYMYSKKEMQQMMKKTCGVAIGKEMFQNLTEIYNKVDVDINFEESIPIFDDIEGKEKSLALLSKYFLKERTDKLIHGDVKVKQSYSYAKRLEDEYKAIEAHDLIDYFLIVQDYVNFAKANNIKVGPGRGSVCGSLIAYYLGITDIDPIETGNIFERFIRIDKKKMPDIDLDFEYGEKDSGEKRELVLNYLLEKYKGRSAQIVTYGYYKTKNLVNTMCKALEIPFEEAEQIKKLMESVVDDKAHFEYEALDVVELLKNKKVAELNEKYDDFVDMFCRLYGQPRYLGTHAAGVVITSGPITNWTAVMKVGTNYVTAFDKYDVEGSNMLKFDLLGLKTLNIIKECEEITGDIYNPDKNDIHKRMYEEFSNANTTGVFQLGSKAAKQITKEVRPTGFQDLIAIISLDRPGPLKLGMHEVFSKYKKNPAEDKPWYQFTKDTYGCIIYQEQVMEICKNIGQMHPDDADKVMKFKFDEEQRLVLKDKFVKGAITNENEFFKLKKLEASTLFDNMTLYLFNKAHASGYARISEETMYHKLKHGVEFWYATLKYNYDDSKLEEIKNAAVNDGVCLFLPHVNYSADYSIRKVDGGKAIQEGLSTIKNVGTKAAQFIENERKENGHFRNKEEFLQRCKGRAVTSRVIEALENSGALEFDKKLYHKRVTKYNTATYAKRYY